MAVHGCVGEPFVMKELSCKSTYCAPRSFMVFCSRTPLPVLLLPANLVDVVANGATSLVDRRASEAVECLVEIKNASYSHKRHKFRDTSA